MSRLNVYLDARAVDGTVGGVQQVMIGMAAGLGALTDSEDRYNFLAYEDAHDWLLPYLGPNSRLALYGPAPPLRSPTRRVWRQLSNRLPILQRARELVHGRAWSRTPLVPRSNGLVERERADVVHFLSQTGFSTPIPTIFHPHDLQYVHFPEFFRPGPRRWLDRTFRLLSEQAAMVSVGTTWTQRDVIKNLDLDDRKVRVTELAPALGAYGSPSLLEQERTATRLELQEPFALYPAQTWPHKNHLRLLDALARLRDEHGIVVSLVCTGSRTEHYEVIQAHIRRRGLERTVRFLGFLPPSDLASVYRLARLVVIPTLFESASGPIWDAFIAGTAVTCSNVTSLPAQTSGAAEMFDPLDVTAMAEGIRRVWVDPERRKTLISRGHEVVSRFTWTNTARNFRAHYRRLASVELGDEDRALLARSPLL